MKLDKLYVDLFNLHGIAGYEHQVRAYMKAFMQPYADEIVQDRIGSIFAIKRSKIKDAPSVMIAGHMDEVGAIVTGITKTGGLKIQPLGGIQAQVFISQHMLIHTQKGIIEGVIGSVPPHIKSQDKLETNQLLVDIGADDKAHAEALGVKPGDMITPFNRVVKTADKTKVISKAVDNRWGAGMALDLLRDIYQDELDVTLIIGATVQEEVGLRGAQTSVQKFKPDVFIALDASPLNDINDDKNAFGEMGKGFLIRLHDPRNVMHRGMREHMLALTKKHKIPYQIYLSKGGTDAARALDLNRGTLTATIGLPARYIHSTAAMFSLKDHQAARKMIRVFLKYLNKETIEKIKQDA